METFTDVFIVGGGPAGLAAAIALRQRGISCIVAEALFPAIDKACGEGLMPDAISALQTLGVEITEEDGYPFRGIRFANSEHQVNASFPGSHGIGVRRTVLHTRLIEHADEVGARLLWGARSSLVDRQTALINGKQIKFRWLIGADGQESSVRRWAGLGRAHRTRLRYGFRNHYQITPWSEFVEVHWAPGGQLYITPVSAESVCVVYLTSELNHDRTDFLSSFPDIANRLRGVPVVSRRRGAVSATRKLRRVASGNVALIGDASGSTDAVTGEGLAMSFRQAHVLAESIESGSLEHYSLAHSKIGRLPHAMGSLMLTMDRWPSLEVRIMRALSGCPGLFRELLSVHVGTKGLLEFAAQRGPLLGWKLIAEACRG